MPAQICPPRPFGRGHSWNRSSKIAQMEEKPYSLWAFYGILTRSTDDWDLHHRTVKCCAAKLTLDAKNENCFSTLQVGVCAEFEHCFESAAGNNHDDQQPAQSNNQLHLPCDSTHLDGVVSVLVLLAIQPGNL